MFLTFWLLDKTRFDHVQLNKTFEEEIKISIFKK